MLGYSPGIGVGIGRSFAQAPFNTIQWQLVTYQWDSINTVWA